MHCDTGAVCIVYSMYSIGTARNCFGEGILTYNVRYSYVRKDEMRKRQPQHHHHQHHHHHTGCTSPAINKYKPYRRSSTLMAKSVDHNG